MSCQKTTGTFQSTDGVHILNCYTYAPAQKPRAILQISHGMCEYIERYAEFADALCARGILVCGSDHLGHGKAAMKQGTLGYFAAKDGWKLLPEDLHQLTNQMKKEYPNTPYFLLGHSMGSFVARAYLSRYGNELNGAILMGTSGGNVFAGLGIFLANRIIRMKGEMYQSPLLNQLSSGLNNQRFLEEQDKHSWLTRDSSLRELYGKDPLCNFVFTAAGFRDLFALLRHVSSSQWADTVPKGLPILLTSGDDDPIGNYGKGVRKVKRRLDNANVRDVTLKLYEKGRHEILNEINRKTVYEDIGLFIERLLENG